MHTLTYDHSFAGFLTCIFTVYEYKWHNVTIVKDAAYVPDMLSAHEQITTDAHKADRVLTKLTKVLGKQGVNQLINGFLTEDDSIENTLLGVIRYALDKEKHTLGAGKWALTDYTHPDVMQLAKWLKMVSRERHRMTAFVRFELMKNDVYFACVNPDFNVLPLIRNHFKNRYADQNWAIYDVNRGYGIFYQKNTEQIDIIMDVDEQVLKNPASQFSKEETAYQALWQGFFTHVNIPERKNNKLHKQYLPKRYWQYLTEKYI